MGSLETRTAPPPPMGDCGRGHRRPHLRSIRAGAGCRCAGRARDPFGGEDFFAGVAGVGIALSVATLTAVIEEMAEAFIRIGARRIMIVSGHAGTIGPAEGGRGPLRHQRRHHSRPAPVA